MDTWIVKDSIVLNGTIGYVVIPGMYRYDAVITGNDEIQENVHTDVVMDEMPAGEAGETGHMGGRRRREGQDWSLAVAPEVGALW